MSPTKELTMLRIPFFCLLCAGLLASCLPIPHRQRRSPGIHGVFHQNGAPLAGVQVCMRVNPPRRARADSGGACRGRVTVTGEDGAFSFDQTSEFVYVMWMGDRLDFWTLRFQLPDGRRTIWQDSGYWGGPKRVDLRCVQEPSEARIVGASGIQCHKRPASR
jgi:hypothetical protein